jgi:hypothetical protein
MAILSMSGVKTAGKEGMAGAVISGISVKGASLKQGPKAA